MYNLPLKLILGKLTDIDNKLALLVENQSIDMLEEISKEEKTETEEEGEGEEENECQR